MNRNQLFPSRFLKANDLQGKPQIVGVIEELKVEDVGDDQQQKPVLYFKGKKKGLVLNATNYDAIADTYGDETDDWADQPIELYPTQVDFKGKRVDAIRVRIPKAKAEPAPKPKAAPVLDELDDAIPF